MAEDGPDAVTVGRVSIATETVPDPVHPLAAVPVTVYVVDPAGVAVTDDPVVALKPVEGDHA